MISSERLYPIRRPLAATVTGAAVAILGGLIGLGGAEFRLPILIGIFALLPAPRGVHQSADLPRHTRHVGGDALEFPADGQRCGFPDRNWA
jgi:hypothetical protein